MSAFRGYGRAFVACWVVFAVHWTPFIVREHFPALTLAAQGTLNVERFDGWIEDIFRSPAGGAYINNNPGASLVGAIPIVLADPWLDRLAAGGRPPTRPRRSLEAEVYGRAVREGLDRFLLGVAFLTVALVMAPLSALMAVSVGSALERGGVPRRLGVSSALLLAFGTPVFFRTGYLNHNLMVAAVATFGFLLLFDPEKRPLRAGRVTGAGLLAGFGVLADYTGLIVAATLAAYTALRAGDGAGRRDGMRRAGWAGLFCVAALPGLAALLVYQRIAFGPAALPAQHYMTPSAPTALGYRGLDWPALDLMWANLFDPRFGMLVFCPLLGLAFAAPWVRRGPHAVPVRESWLFLAFFGAFFLFCAVNQYSRLQWTTGFRYLIPVVPGLFVLALQTLQAFPRRLGAAILGASVVESWLIAIRHGNPLEVVAALPWLDYSWVRRMYDLGLIDHPAAWSAAAALLSLGVAGWVVRRDIACAS